MKFAITSSSEHKVNALESALVRMKIFAEIIVRKGDSGQNEQPVGEKEILQGAHNRIKTCDAKDVDAIVSIENGIYVAEDGSIKDFSIIIVLSLNGEFTWSASQTVDFPREQYQKAKKLGFNKHTVGSLLAKDGIVKDGTDPHLELAGISRTEIMTGPIVTCLTKLGYNSNS